MILPPYHMTRMTLAMLAVVVNLYRDRDAMRMLWWQSSIAPGGINEHQAVHWACRE